MLNDFIDKKGSLYVKDSENIVPTINTIIDYFSSDSLIVFANDSHDEDDVEFKNYPKHCVERTWGADIYSEIKIPRMCLRATKTTFSALSNVELLYVLKHMRIQTLYICGVVTEVCVYHTAIDAVKSQFDTVVIRNAICPLDEINGNQHIEHMINQGVGFSDNVH